MVENLLVKDYQVALWPDRIGYFDGCWFRVYVVSNRRGQVMARRVFFSFHYQRDVWRTNQIRNAHIVDGTAAAGFQDASLWEEAKRKGDAAVKALIDKGLDGTTVTAVLIGSETANRKYVKYEIDQSIIRGNGLLGVYIHNLRDRNSNTDPPGRNPFDNLYWEKNGQKVYLSSVYQAYDWISDNGYQNFGSWVEAAAKKAGR